MKIKIDELSGYPLDYAVGVALGHKMTVASFGPLFGKGYMAPVREGYFTKYEPRTTKSYSSDNERMFNRRSSCSDVYK